MSPSAGNVTRPWHKYARTCMRRVRWNAQPDEVDDFVQDVEASVFLIDSKIELDRFFAMIDRALNDSALSLIAEGAIFRRAINDTIEFLATNSCDYDSVEIDSISYDNRRPIPDADEAEIVAANAALVLKAMKRLPKPFDTTDRLMLKWKHQGLSQKEIAKQLGISPSTVCVRLRAIYDHIREQRTSRVV